MEKVNPLFESAATEKTKVTAQKNSIDDVSKCPVCEKQMRVLTCNGIETFVCLEHRVALPCPD